MAVSSWLAVIISMSRHEFHISVHLVILDIFFAVTVAAILTLVAARRAIDIANMPPPVSPDQIEAPVMRWLNRNDLFLTTERYNRQYP